MSTARLRTRLARLMKRATRQNAPHVHPYARAAACCAIAVTCLLVFTVAPGFADVPKNVLILTSEATTMPGMAVVVNGTVGALRAWGPVNIFVESLERSRFPSDSEGLAAFFRQRYAERRLDLVITVCAPALDFALRHRDTLFHGAPLVFSFVEPGMVRPFGPDANMSGVFVNADFSALVGLALKLHPGARRLLVVNGVSEFDRGWQRSVEQVARAFDSRLATTFLTDKSLRDLLGDLATAPTDALILYLTVSRDSDGAAYVPRDVLDMIRRVSAVPIYGPSITYAGHGVVGGPLFDLEAHAAGVGRIAARVLSGEPVGGIRPVKTANTLVFDWRELRRFGIAEGALPAQAVILNRDKSFWTVHEGWVVATLVLVFGQTVLIGMMLAQRRKRNSLQASLRARLRFETILSDVSTAVGGVPVAQIDTAVRAAIGVVRQYLAVDRVSILELRTDGSLVRAVDDAAPASPAAPPSYRPAELPLIALTLSSLQPFVMETLDDLPKEAVREHAAMHDGGIRSLALIPLEVGGQSLGALSCVSYTVEKKWPADLVQQVRALARVLATVVQRRQTEAAVSESDRLKSAILSSMPAHITVIDRDGVIITVNDGWMAYARANGVRDEASVSPGANYLRECERAAAAGAPGAAEALAGIKAVCEGRSDLFECEYNCRGPETDRWFAMKVTVLRRAEGGALVTHRDITREKRQETALRHLSGRLINAQEDERRRIARELHDDLQQRLALLAIELDGIALGQSPLTPEELASLAKDLWRQANEVSTELHHLSHRLHPTKLEALGLLATVQGYCRELSKVGLNVTFAHEGVPPLVAPDVGLCVFRIVQESLQNVLKHSGATEAGVTMSTADQTLHLVVSDTGRGFNVDTASSQGGLGLVSMRERLHLVGGTMNIRSIAGQGTSVEFRVPLGIVDGAAPNAATQQRTGMQT